VLVTHCHKDHLDETAERLLPRDLPAFCQPEDEERLRAIGLDVRAVDGSLDWDGLVLHRVPARHGSGAVAEALAPVSGFVLDDVYLAGDTVWYGAVEETIARFGPRVAIVNAGGASFLEGGLIVMGIDDVREVASRVPVVVCVHMEAINHCHLSRADLAAAVPGVVIPRDGETVEV
jgi:L-ascorbate metabolism protein UlaG (beta-lactamase superfamily)